jgi:hypothetical protein
VKRLDTNAARFAPLDLSECLDDSGPFCESTLRQLRSSERADYYGG